MKSKIMPSVILGSICVVVALLLSVVNMFTSGIIIEAQKEKDRQAMAEILPGGGNAVSIYETLDKTKIGENITDVYYAEGVGYIFRVTAMGKDSGGMVIMCGVDLDGKITRTKVTSEKETPSYAEKVYSRVDGEYGEYIGATSETISDIIISGSTLTSRAYATAVRSALNAFEIVKGGAGA